MEKRDLEQHLNESQIEFILRRALIPEWEATERADEHQRAHLDKCELCRARLKARESVMEGLSHLKSDVQAARGALCPSAEVWIEVAAGVHSIESEAYLAHATGCDHCAMLLRDAAADVTEELTPEEAIRIGAMCSATPEWQQRLAARMAGIEQAAGHEDEQLSPQPDAAKPRRIRWLRSRWAWAGAFAFSLAIVAYVLIRVRTPQDGLDETNQLIAEAYTQQRAILFRIPGAAYAPYRGTRGANADLPASLDMANFKIKTAKKRGDKDARWLVASANAKLLEADFGGAVEILEGATNGDSYIPGADLALATAYFERAIQNHNTVDLGSAREAIGRALEREPGNPVALFNRARLDQEIGLFSQASDDWTKYLQAEPSGDWSREAKENLALCHLTTGGHGTTGPRDATRRFLQRGESRVHIECGAPFGCRVLR